MTDPLYQSLLGALISLTVMQAIALVAIMVAASWAWSWSARFDSLNAERGDDGRVHIHGELKPKDYRKPVVRKLKRPGNGVRKVPNVDHRPGIEHLSEMAKIR